MPCSGLVLWLGASFVSCFGFPVLASSVKTCTFSRRATATCHRGIAGAAQKKETRAGQACAEHRSSELETHCVQGGGQHTSRRRTLHHPTVDAISRNCTSAPELHITPTSIPQVTLDFVGRCRKRRNLAKPRGRHCSRHGLLPFDAALMRLGSDSGR